MGRTSRPLEVKRRTGRSVGRDSGGRKLPEVVSITSLRMADGVPDAPDDLGRAGLALWTRAWSMAVTWLAPDTDRDAVEQAARLADDLTVARGRYRATTDPADGRIVATLSVGFSKALSRLGFDPTARSTLGVAEVKKMSALEKMLADRG